MVLIECPHLGRSHLCAGCVNQRGETTEGGADSWAMTQDWIWVRFSGGSLCNVVISLSITSWRCLFHIKNGTW